MKLARHGSFEQLPGVERISGNDGLKQLVQRSQLDRLNLRAGRKFHSMFVRIRRVRGSRSAGGSNLRFLRGRVRFVQSHKATARSGEDNAEEELWLDRR